MSRYIDADSLIQAIEKGRANNPHKNVIAFQTHNNEYAHFIKMVLTQPTADVVEVVRCRDCTYHTRVGKEEYRCTRGLPFYTRLDDFCSYGERRAEE